MSVQRVVNLTPKGHPLEFEANDDYVRIIGEHSSTVCEISLVNRNSTGYDVAYAISLARDAGYRMAMKDIRNMIGVG